MGAPGAAPGIPAPLFFLSYARTPRPAHLPAPVTELNSSVLQLFRDLSIHVGELVATPPGSAPGFVDRTMGGGERWTAELLHSAGTCQVFVALVSPRMLSSEWCGMEWHAFARREVVPRLAEPHPAGTNIIPVRWTPVRPQDMPRAVREIQQFTPAGLPDPDIETQYQTEGLYGLLALNMDDAYRAVVWRLAQRVVELHQRCEVAPLVAQDTTELVNAFAEER